MLDDEMVSIMSDLRELSRRATPTPWALAYVPVNSSRDRMDGVTYSDHWRCVGPSVPTLGQADIDSQLIVMMRASIDLLLNHLEGSRGRAAAWREGGGEAMTDDDKRCIRCRIGKMWTVDGKELCMGCSIVIRQTRILELEREAIMGMVEIDSLRARLAETVEKAKAEVGGFQKVMREAESQRDILAKALQFYASPAPWTRDALEGSYGDWGNKARAVLLEAGMEMT